MTQHTKEQLIECATGRLEAMRSALETVLSPFEHSAMCVSIQLTEIALATLTAKEFEYRAVGVMSEAALHRLESREARFIALWPRPGIEVARKRPDDGLIVYAKVSK